MNLLIRSAIIIDPNSPFNHQTTDILIENGIISQIAPFIKSDTEIFEACGKYVTPGFFDLNCNIGEPGLETREDLESGTKAAAAGGFTGVALMPNTQPPVSSKTEVEYLLNRAGKNLVDVYPLGAISYKRGGTDLAEMYDMHLSGAKAFTDGNKPVQDAGLMERALLYVQNFGGRIFSYPEDTAIAGSAKVNEGTVSTLLGMKGLPALAEELMVARDLYLVEYTGSGIHFSTISTARSAELIRQAKQKGLPVTCDVAAHHLVLTDEALLGFDSLYKVKPPLRTATDVEALKAGLANGTIDAVVSQHTPHEVEFKEVEFEVAEYGMIGLQTVLPLVLMAGLSIESIVEKLVSGPRRIMNIPVPVLEPGQPANLNIIDLDAEWLYSPASNHSKSKNSPFLNQNLKGKALLTINNNQLFK